MWIIRRLERKRQISEPQKTSSSENHFRACGVPAEIIVASFDLVSKRWFDLSFFSFSLMAKSRFNACSSTDRLQKNTKIVRKNISSVISTPVTACDVNFYDACKVKIVIESQQANSQPELTKCLSIISGNDFGCFISKISSLVDSPLCEGDYGDYLCSVAFNQNCWLFVRFNKLIAQRKFLSGCG